MNAYGYLRVSSLGAVDGDGFPRQREAIQKYAAAHDIQILDWFHDDGVPGKTELANRAGLGACMARCESDGIKIVIVEIPDRLARDTVVSELIIREFQKIGVSVISASGGIDLTAGDDNNPTAKLVRQILAAVAEFDRCVIVLKTRAARERIRASGKKCEGRKAFGTKAGEADTLRTILTTHEQGGSPEAIANMLDALKVPTRYGKRWHSGTVSKILRRQKSAKQVMQVNT